MKKLPAWPTYPDGMPKTMGELTKEEQRAQFNAAVERLKPEFAREGIKLVIPSDLN